MTNNYTNQIMSILSGEVNINSVSQDVIDRMLDDHPYSPYGHLINYLKAKSSNSYETNSLLNKLATYSPDRAWLQEVLNTSLSSLDIVDAKSDRGIPSESKNSIQEKTIFEFDFNVAPDEESEISEMEIGEAEVVNDDVVEDNILENNGLSSSKAEYVEEVQYFEATEFETKDDNSAGPLSSYTVWLQSLKSPDKTDESGSFEEENNLQTHQEEEILEKSTRKDNDLFGGIITETLAQLLANQGQKEKAIEMYERLALIFPNKSAFFAAKIDQLKRDIA